MITCKECDAKIAVAWRLGKRVEDGSILTKCKDCGREEDVKFQ